MNPLVEALVARLAGDATLMAMGGGLNGVWDGVAEQGTPLCYIIVNQQDGRPWYTHGGEGGRDYEYQVKSLTPDEASLGGQIDGRIHELLQDHPLAIVGYTTIYLRRKADIKYPEVRDGGAVIWHIGGIYDIEVVPA